MLGAIVVVGIVGIAIWIYAASRRSSNEKPAKFATEVTTRTSADDAFRLVLRFAQASGTR